MFKKAAQQGRSKQEAEAYAGGYVEASSDARTPLADFFNILLGADAAEAARIHLRSPELEGRHFSGSKVGDVEKDVLADEDLQVPPPIVVALELLEDPLRLLNAEPLFHGEIVVQRQVPLPIDIV